MTLAANATRAAILLLWALRAAAAADEQPLKPVGVVELPGVEGRIDHLAVAPKGRQLFVAALGNNTLEAIDTATLKHLHSEKGLAEPQGVAFVPEQNWVVVTGGRDGTVRAYDAATRKLAKQIDHLDDADNVRYDPAARRLYVGYGNGALAVIDARTFEKVGEAKLDAHPESFQLEKDGPRIFVNVPQAGHVAVVDRQTTKVIAKWPVTSAAAHFPMALDEARHRLFVGCRKPAKLVVLDTENGNEVASVDCAADADDVSYDAANKRLYVIGGEGLVNVFSQSDADHYRLVGSLKTAPGARTGLFVPADGRLYVAVPHRGAQRAEIRVFDAAKD